MPRPVSVRSGQVEFLKLNLEKRELRDAYQWLLALSWPQFAAFIAGVYIVINLVFAEFYALGGESIAGRRDLHLRSHIAARSVRGNTFPGRPPEFYSANQLSSEH